MSGQPLYLMLLWHMHQPYYKDLASDRYLMPWVGLHSTSVQVALASTPSPWRLALYSALAAWFSSGRTACALPSGRLLRRLWWQWERLETAALYHWLQKRPD